jgi:acetyl esterase/lipase
LNAWIHRARRAARVGARVGSAAARTTLSRLRHGPRHAHWTWTYELTVTFVRDAFFRPSPGLEATRARMDELGRRGRRVPGLTWQPTTVGGVPAEWVYAPAPSEVTIVYLHGGGYAFGSVDSHASLIAKLAQSTGARVLAPLYRLAPEHPCPAAIDDVVAVWRALLAGGLAPHRALIGGDSAGGGLTVAAMVAIRDAGLPLPAGAFLLSPWTDLGMTQAHSHAFWRDDYLGTQAGLREFAKHYLHALAEDDPRASPLYADLRGLPPLLILAGGAEILLDDSTRLAERATAAGVEVELVVEPGEVHVSPLFDRLSTPAKRGWEQITAFVARRARAGERR